MTAPKTQTIDAWLATHAAHQPGHPALHFEAQSWSYQQLHEWTETLAGYLYHECGLKRGDRVAFYGHNCASEVALIFAAARLGVIVVPLNWRLAVEELRYIVENCDASALFHGPEFAAEAQELCRGLVIHRAPASALAAPHAPVAAPKEAFLSDPLLIVYTSGTTGRPKGAVLTQDAVLWNALSSLHAHEFTARDHILNVLPLFHVGGINIQMMPCFFVGGTVTLHGAFDPAAVIEAFAHHGITTSVCVPTMMRALLAHPSWSAARFDDLRMLNTGSTDVPVEILQEVNARGIPMVQVYGATETGPIASYQRAAEAAGTVGSIGRPAAHVQLRLVDQNGQDCPTGTPGEIWIKGPNNFTGYWQDPDATAAALDNGWFKTGDLARCDTAGLLWFVGRSKHVIISGGENIYPAEIERLIAGLPGLTEVAVTGRADPRWGEVPVVVAARTANGPDAETILTACDGHLARFKRPKDVVFVDALPRNAMGKVLIDEVRALVNSSAVATDETRS